MKLLTIFYTMYVVLSTYHQKEGYVHDLTGIHNDGKHLAVTAENGQWSASQVQSLSEMDFHQSVATGNDGWCNKDEVVYTKLLSEIGHVSFWKQGDPIPEAR